MEKDGLDYSMLRKRSSKAEIQAQFKDVLKKGKKKMKKKKGKGSWSKKKKHGKKIQRTIEEEIFQNSDSDED